MWLQTSRKISLVFWIFSSCFSMTCCTSFTRSSVCVELVFRFAIIFWISPAARLDCSESCWISDATTENPLPCSPARAASILAFKDSRFVWEAIAVISSVVELILATDSLVRLVCSDRKAMDSFTLRMTSLSSATCSNAAVAPVFIVPEISCSSVICVVFSIIMSPMQATLLFAWLASSACVVQLVPISCVALLTSFITW